MSLLVVVVVLYPLILLSISVYRARAITSHDDFMVAGRSVWGLRAGRCRPPGRAPAGVSLGRRSGGIRFLGGA